MTTLDRDLVAERSAAVTVREPGTIPMPSGASGSSAVTRPGGAPRRWLVGVAALAASLPLVTDPHGWFVFVAARWSFLVAVTAVLLAGLAITGRLRRLPALRWWTALVAAAAISALSSGAVRVALLGTNDRRAGAAMWLVHGALFVVGGAAVRCRSDLRVLVRGMSIGAVGVTVLTAAQRAGWSFPPGVGSRVRPGGPLGNADFLGAFAALALLVAIGAAIDRAERDEWRLLHLVAAMGSAFCLVVSGTRAAWVGVVAGLVTFGVAAARDAGVPRRAAWGGVAIAALGLVGLGMWAGMGDRLDTVTSGTAAGRLATWERTASVVGERPVLGWGPEGFAAGFGRSVDDAWEREYGRRLVPDRAHNGLLDVGASLGLVGLAAYAGTVAATGRAVRRSLRVAPSPVLVGVAAGLVAYLVQQQFLFQLPDVDALAWLLAGAVVGLGVGVTGEASPVGRRALVLRVAPPVVALIVVAALGFAAVRADRAARRASDLLAAAPAASVVAADRAVDLDPQTMHALVLADAALASGDERALLDAGERLGAVRDATPDDGRLTLARSRLARGTGIVRLVEGSRAEVVALLDDDPARSDAWVEFGDIELRLGDAPSAQRAFERAVTLHPERASWWARLAVAADRADDPVTAADAISRVDPAHLDPDGLALRQRLLAGSVVRSPGR